MSNTPRHPAEHLFSLAGISIATLVVAGTLLGVSLYTGVLSGSSQLGAVVSATLIDLTNENRDKAGLPDLVLNETLTAAAQAKANDMAAKGYFAHTSPEGLTPWHWFKESGYDYRYAGENLAVNFSDSENVEDAWMQSKEHRANIMSSRYTEIGIATAVGEYNGKKTTFVVQMFGTPKTVAAAPLPATPQEPSALAVADESPLVPAETEAVVEPAPVAPTEAVLGAEIPPQTTPIERFMVSPQTILQTIYILCAIIILGALALTTRFEFKRHHFRHVAAASFLFVLMGGCLVAANVLIFGPIVIG